MIRYVCFAFFKQLKGISDFDKQPPSILQHVFVLSEELLNERELFQDMIFSKHPDWKDADGMVAAAFTRFRETSDTSDCFLHSFTTEYAPGQMMHAWQRH